MRFPTKSIDELDALISADFFNGSFRSTVLTAALALKDIQVERRTICVG